MPVGMWSNPQEAAYLVKFTEELLDENLHFLWSVFTVVPQALH